MLMRLTSKHAQLAPRTKFDHNLDRKDVSHDLCIIDWIQGDTLSPLIDDHAMV